MHTNLYVKTLLINLRVPPRSLLTRCPEGKQRQPATELPPVHQIPNPSNGLRSAGKVYLAVDFSAIQVEEMPEAQVVELLDIFSAGLNLEDHEPEGTANWYLKQEILKSAGFKRTRVLMAQVCG